MALKTKVLLVEDDVNLGFLLVDFLESNNFDVKLYKDGESGLRAFLNNLFDFCIIDIMLPKLDGYSIVKQIRAENKRVPIIFLTAKSMKQDKIKGFEHGVDDYITKPFDEDELLCRIRAILNRTNQEITPCDFQKFTIGQYYFDCRNQSLQINSEIQRLTVKESEVLKQLCQSKNNITKREDILVAIWGDNDYFAGRSLDVFIAKLRKHLKDDPNIRIENIPTVGYILSDEKR